MKRNTSDINGVLIQTSGKLDITTRMLIDHSSDRYSNTFEVVP